MAGRQVGLALFCLTSERKMTLAPLNQLESLETSLALSILRYFGVMKTSAIAFVGDLFLAG